MAGSEKRLFVSDCAAFLYQSARTLSIHGALCLAIRRQSVGFFGVHDRGNGDFARYGVLDEMTHFQKSGINHMPY